MSNDQAILEQLKKTLGVDLEPIIIYQDDKEQAEDRFRFNENRELIHLNLFGYKLSELPPEIGQLQSLTSLNLDGNQLSQLPPEIGQLQNLTSLNLDGNQLSQLPPEIGQLQNLTSLELTRNQLSQLPPEIGQLTHLVVLHIWGNPFSALPSEIQNLTNLSTFSFNSDQLAELPATIFSLENLRLLDVSGNITIKIFPKSIKKLVKLKTLHLTRSQITKLSSEVGQLQSLTSLNLDGNQLSQLPPEIIELQSLTSLNLDGNQLSQLPPEIIELQNLTSLSLSSNQLSQLPPEIIELQNLTSLSLSSNQLSQLPPEIDQLQNLTSLSLSSNQLSQLPPEIGQLKNKIRLNIADNPWPDALTPLFDRPTLEILTYLRSLQGGSPQYEAKILLIGEGGVGKSSLLAALKGDQFVEGRLTTHGIEQTTLSTTHPNTTIEEALRLNFWDFGGQEVYRITHQFFFSRDAVYLLVWKPREGQEENALEDWLERIQLRVGTEAKVLIVATHCNQRQPELDYPYLESRFGHILVEHFEVDNEDNTGIEALLNEIKSVVTTHLKHIGTPLSQAWLAAKDEILAQPETHITYATFEQVCHKHNLDTVEVKALSILLHTLGHIIYYDKDGLRDYVVLKPEWLTKAISYILDDGKTRIDKGVLDHRRLKQIWSTHQDEEWALYTEVYFPFFLRLMEEYDVSVRLEGRNESLIPQLVPYEQPKISWQTETSVERGQLTLICEMRQNPPGLIAWLTARNHRWSTETHWRKGVFLRYRDGHEALIEFESQTSLMLTVTVQGVYPSDFMSILRNSLQNLIEDRWPYLNYELLVPCPTQVDGQSCTGRFKLETLKKARNKRQVWPCGECIEDIEIAQILDGISIPQTSIEDKLEQIQQGLEDLDQKTSQEMRIIAAQSNQVLRQLLQASLSEARQGPRLFTLSPVSSGLSTESYSLRLWCEHSEEKHPCYDAPLYVIEQPKVWLVKMAPYMSVMLKGLKIVAGITAGAGGVIDERMLSDINEEVRLMDKVVSTLAPKGDWEGERPVEEGAAFSADDARGLREFHDLLAHVGWRPGAANLRRVMDKSTGDILWVCPRHYKEYDPGLPQLPEQI